MPGNGPILIGGSGRCGTSVLAAMLMESPNVFPFMEPEPLYDLFIRWLGRRVPAPLFKRTYAAKVAASLQGDASRWYRTIAGDDVFDALAPEAIGAAWDRSFAECRNVDDYTNAFAGFADTLLGDFARAQGRRRWCVKLPGILYEAIDVVFRLHPDARFIHIVRDGRDVVGSLFNEPFVPGSRLAGAWRSVWNQSTDARRFRHAIDLWAKPLREGLKREERTPANQRLQVRFEDLAADPSREIARVFEFIGEDTGLPDDYFAPNGEWSGNNFSRKRAHVGRYREILTEDQVARLEAEHGDVLEHFGYAGASS